MVASEFAAQSAEASAAATEQAPPKVRTKGPLRKTLCFVLWMSLSAVAFGAAVKRSHCARHQEACAKVRR